MAERDTSARPDAAAKLARALGVAPEPAERDIAPDGQETATEDLSRDDAAPADSDR